MLRIAIVDDERKERERIGVYTGQYFAARGEEAKLSFYDDGAALVRDIAKKPDILFLDIQMEGMDGMSAARQIRLHDEEALIIFVTNMAQYALDGYSVEALDFVIKPVDETGIKRVLDKAVKRLGGKEPLPISVRGKEGIRIVDAKEICYIETYGRHLLLHTATETFACHETMQSMEQKLPASFFRCHNAYLLNLRRVERIEGNDIVAAGQRVPLSKHRRKAFLQAMTKYVKEEML